MLFRSVDKSVKSLVALLLEKHMHGCLVDSVRGGDMRVVDEIIELFKRFA